jgi:hypothetical protein
MGCGADKKDENREENKKPGEDQRRQTLRRDLDRAKIEWNMLFDLSRRTVTL